jgi:hypothetical protein
MSSKGVDGLNLAELETVPFRDPDEPRFVVGYGLAPEVHLVDDPLRPHSDDDEDGPVVSEGTLDVERFLNKERNCTIPDEGVENHPRAVVEEEFDLVSFVVEFEAEELDQEEIVKGFQSLIDNDLVWHLQGSYQCTAHKLIEAGLCHVAGG